MPGSKRKICFPITNRAYYGRSQLLIRKLHAHPDLDLHPQSWNASSDTPDGSPTGNHGTACAGIVVGLAPEVEIYSVRVLGADLRGKGAAFLAGLEWAVEKGVQAMNLSLSSKSERLFPFFHEVVDQAYFHQVCLVSAVNNVPGLSFPSTFSSVFSVAAHGIPEPETFFYNPSPPVEWGAWGVDVPIGWKDGATTVATGNSFAAPHMCGLVARILSKHPGLTPFEVKAVLAAIANDPAAAD